MMAFVWWCVPLLSLVAAVSVNADLTLDCRPDFVTLVWTEHRPHVDTSLFRLGSCFPSSTTAREAVFSVYFTDCNFRQLVTGKTLMYFTELSYKPSSDPQASPESYLIVCEYDRPERWSPEYSLPEFDTYDQDALVFHIGLMNADFSGPAESTSFPLGSIIPIMASVEQGSHQPLLLLLEECEASTTPDLRPGSSLYTIISNKGCLVDSKESRSRFEPRENSSEIKLSLQAFRFALGEEVFIHCTLVAWDPNGLDKTKKACHYVKDQGWNLLDNPSYNSLCDCCGSTCKSRKIRSLESGIYHDTVPGVV
ncbi:zona pellucida glycoprotein 3f, tandem duplicate 1 [Salarias fasciatus]|uniref:zona pellucida glycoprotein 3f, tandem duplicate 1 n=1 Tax=Salarias fasciatus TaxID=181472 RepID=UPI001176F791|nr:zona pellucida sperm-binding protein 3-like [Salarias fasciatus]